MIITACAFNPSVGVTYEEFMTDWLISSNFDQPILVNTFSGTEVYESEGVYYYFSSNRLNAVDNGRLLEENEKKQQ